MSEQPLTLRARWIFPVTAPPLRDGQLTLHRGRVVAVGRAEPGIPAHDLGDVAIVPGLINAHTHLEFSDCSSPLGRPGIPLPTWIEELIAARRSASGTSDEAIRRGLDECLASGTTLLGEIATSDWRQSMGGFADRPLVIMFREAIAPTAERVPATLAAVDEFLAAPGVGGFCPAVSPHAPYTVHPQLLESLIGRQTRMAMHLAESPEELELLATGGGPFRTMLENLGAWDPDPSARLATIGDYLAALSKAMSALVVHGNYLSIDNIRFLAQHPRHMAVVYCPRTHAYFGHAEYPLARMLAAGVTMTLGTDSRASNPDLKLWEEMRFVAERHPDVSPETVLRMGTYNAARAWGFGEIGSIKVDDTTMLAVVRLSAHTARDPHDLLFAPGTQVIQTWSGDRPLWSSAS